MIAYLSGKDVAGSPADLSTEMFERLNKNCGLHGHVKRARNAGTLQRSIFSVLSTSGHETFK